MIIIKHIRNNKKRFLALLLLGDEQEEMVDKYLERGNMFALYNGDLKSICVITQEDENTCELKNIATHEKYQGQGYGRQLIEYICSYYSTKFRTIVVGTGESPRTLSFYKACGFSLSHRVKNFFTNNYDHPIYEDGVRLNDMIYLKKEISPSIIKLCGESEYDELVTLWELSIRSTHYFLTEDDIQFYKPLVRYQYLAMVELYIIRNNQNRIAAFIGLSDTLIEMLFVHPYEQGKGYGKQLLDFAVREKNIRKVDVNEQNVKALRFYENRGFRVNSRDETDPMGKPYPILHMQVSKLIL